MASEITTPNRRDVLALATGAAASLYLGGARSLGANMAHEALGISFGVPGAFDQAQRALAREDLRSVYTQWRAADAVFDTDPTARRTWDDRYRDLVRMGELEHMEPCEASIEAREFRDWVSGIVPSEPERCRQVWPDIGGLSRRYAWLNAMFEAALYRHADAWWACEEGYRRAGRRSLKDVESAALDRSRRRAWRDAERAASRIIKEPALTHGDRILRMRAIEVQQCMPDVFAFKYRRMKTLAAIRMAQPSGGWGPPKKDDS